MFFKKKAEKTQATSDAAFLRDLADDLGFDDLGKTEGRMLRQIADRIEAGYRGDDR